jgi:hypothetical protein
MRAQPSPFKAANMAGISPGTIYNFLSGTSDSLSAGVMQKLAEAHGVTVDVILGGALEPIIYVTHRVGASGRMFDLADDEKGTMKLATPPGIPAGERLAAAILDGDGLHPIPTGWAVYFRQDQEHPLALVGSMAVVRYSGGGDRPVIRTVRRSAAAGLYTLQAFSGALIEDVEITACHRVMAFAAPAPAEK